MNFKNDFKTLYYKFVKNAIKKSLFYSLFISFTVLFIISFIFWYEGVKEYWIALIVFGALEIISFGVLYYIYRPTTKKISKELDSLGLEQRVITMIEYQDDDSLMSRIQRQNAIEHINKFDVKLLKIVFPVLILSFMISACVLGTASTTVSVLSSKGIIKSGKNVVSNIIPPETVYHYVNYEPKKGGMIQGELNQVVEEGKDSTSVIAIAEHGFIFVSWSDGVRDPYRIEKNVTKDIDLFATFITVDEYSELLKNMGEPEVPEEPANGGMQMPEPGEGSEEGTLPYQDNAKIIDGLTYYGETVFDEYQQDMIDLLAQDTELSSDVKKIINDYFDTIEK